MAEIRTIGIVGAGKLGIVLAQLGLRAGYHVNLSGSGEPEQIALSVETLAPGATAVATAELARVSDVIILAMPLKNLKMLDPKLFCGKLVIDAMNYWWETDGDLSDVLLPDMTQSEAVQQHLKYSRVVKAFNHMGYHHLLDAVNLEDKLGRKAMAIAGDSQHDVAIVEHLVRSVGLDPLVIGDLSSGHALEAGMPAFGANLARSELAGLLHTDS